MIQHRVNSYPYVAQGYVRCVETFGWLSRTGIIRKCRSGKLKAAPTIKLTFQIDSGIFQSHFFKTGSQLHRIERHIKADRYVFQPHGIQFHLPVDRRRSRIGHCLGCVGEHHLQVSIGQFHIVQYDSFVHQVDTVTFKRKFSKYPLDQHSVYQIGSIDCSLIQRNVVHLDLPT